ncbi:YbaY family lipoprotein [Variovorax sp. YR216]|uniref:YbaY family lipoprotein n=1 Tax=Variovorax sp. YR216 TaxID=1882828 RepID=UPI00089BF7D7|nr:YbaY family lipoprotein [Variovorax sp. YR216]SEB22968.1 putative lipoprotein [Variovorax sp. YR216]
MNKRAALHTLLAAAALPLLAACGTDPSVPPKPEFVRVTGTVAYRERIALDPSAEIVVQLLDASRMDAPAAVLAEQRIRADGRQVPIGFELSVDPARIDPRMRYNVSARILQDGKLLFITDRAYPVLTYREGNTASLMLTRVDR